MTTTTACSVCEGTTGLFIEDVCSTCWTEPVTLALTLPEGLPFLAPFHYDPDLILVAVGWGKDDRWKVRTPMPGRWGYTVAEGGVTVPHPHPVTLPEGWVAQPV